MIQGIGNDIIEISRIRKLVEKYKEHFLNRIFTPGEQEYCLARRDSAPHFTGRFAAKEAIVKALGTGFRKGIDWTDIEIKNDSLGKPVVSFSSSLKEKFPDHHILLSISHCKEYATATAMCVKQ